MAGIVSYGAYIPRYRLRVEDIWDTWMNHIDPTACHERKKGAYRESLRALG